jgi:hypothetical protein
MLKLTSLAIGLLTVVSMAPKSEAMSVTAAPLSLQQPAGDLHAQVIFKIGGQQDYRRRMNLQRRRELELQREREREARRRNYRNRGEYRRDR